MKVNGKTYTITQAGIQTNTNKIWSGRVSSELRPQNPNYDKCKKMGIDPDTMRTYRGDVVLNGERTSDWVIVPAEVATAYDEIINAIANQTAIEHAAEAAAKKAATVEFITRGFESHRVSIDTRGDIGAQCAEIAKMYPNDCTAKSVMRDFNDAQAKAANGDDATTREIARLQRQIASANNGTIYPTWAAAQAAEKEYNDMHNEGGEGYVPKFWTQQEVNRMVEKLQRLTREVSAPTKSANAESTNVESANAKSTNTESATITQKTPAPTPTTTKRDMFASIMRRAWEIARTAVTKFGGKVREFFAEALRQAWAEIKAIASATANQINLLARHDFIKKYGGREWIAPNGEIRVYLDLALAMPRRVISRSIRNNVKIFLTTANTLSVKGMYEKDTYLDEVKADVARIM